MVKTLLLPVFMCIFALGADAQADMPQKALADTVESLPPNDTVAFIYIINTAEGQMVRCMTYCGIKDVRDILTEFFDSVMFPMQVQKRPRVSEKLKRT